MGILVQATNLYFLVSVVQLVIFVQAEAITSDIVTRNVSENLILFEYQVPQLSCGMYVWNETDLSNEVTSA